MAEPWMEIFQREDGLWDWRCKAANGETVFQTSQGFRDRTDAERAIHSSLSIMDDIVTNPHLEIRDAKP